MKDLRSNINRVYRFLTAVLETLLLIGLTPIILAVLMAFNYGLVDVLLLIILIGTWLGLLLGRILAIVDHGWSGLFTLYKSTENEKRADP